MSGFIFYFSAIKNPIYLAIPIQPEGTGRMGIYLPQSQKDKNNALQVWLFSIYLLT